MIHEIPHPERVSGVRAPWRAGADALRRSELGELAALCIEAASPLAFIVSQLLHTGAPFLGGRATQLALFLESESGMPTLARYLATGMDDVTPSAGPDRE